MRYFLLFSASCHIYLYIDFGFRGSQNCLPPFFNSSLYYPSPLALKAFLMNSAFREIKSDTTDELAEISRIGAGELRASRALAATFLAYSPDEDAAPSFSLGLLDVTEDMTIRRRMRLVNLLQEEQTVYIRPQFRLLSSSDKMTIDVYETGTDQLIPDNRVMLSSCSDTFVDLAFNMHSSMIEPNHMNSGLEGSNPEALGKNEIDGYIVITDANDDGNEIGVLFHALARQSAKVLPSKTTLESAFPDTISLINESVGTAQIDMFDMVAISDNLPEGKAGTESPTPDIRAVGVRTVLANRDECEGGFAMEFAINSWERQAHLIPVTYYVFLDVNGDGELDWAVWNGMSNDETSQMQTIVTDLSTYDRTAKYYTEHATNTANTVLRVCSEQIGMTLGEDILGGKRQEITVEVEAYDYLYGGPGDILAQFTMIPFGERYTNNPGISSPAIWPIREPLEEAHEDIQPNGSSTLSIYDMLNGVGESHDNINRQSYGALVFTNSNRGEGARGAATFETESILLLAPGVEAPKRAYNTARAYNIADARAELAYGLIEDPNRSEADLIIDEGIVCRAARLTAAPSVSPTKSPTLSPTTSKKPSSTPTPVPSPKPSTPWPTSFSPTIGTEPTSVATLFMPTASPTSP